MAHCGIIPPSLRYAAAALSAKQYGTRHAMFVSNTAKTWEFVCASLHRRQINKLVKCEAWMGKGWGSPLSHSEYALDFMYLALFISENVDPGKYWRQEMSQIFICQAEWAAHGHAEN
jgi:hypothetical protein